MNYAYLRVSGAGQVDGDGPERQIKKIRDAAKVEFAESQIFSDEGVSGTKELANRESLSRLLNIVRPGDVVWVERADRLARNVIISEMIIQDFQKAGVMIMSAEGCVNITLGDPSDPTSKLIRQVLAVVAEYDKDVTVMRLRMARQRRKAAGHRVEGQKPFGTLDGEAETLRRIIGLADEGKRPAAIAAELNGLGITTRSGKPWKRGTVHQILQRHPSL